MCSPHVSHQMLKGTSNLQQAHAHHTSRWVHQSGHASIGSLGVGDTSCQWCSRTPTAHNVNSMPGQSGTVRCWQPLRHQLHVTPDDEDSLIQLPCPVSQGVLALELQQTAGVQASTTTISPRGCMGGACSALHVGVCWAAQVRGPYLIEAAMLSRIVVGRVVEVVRSGCCQ